MIRAFGAIVVLAMLSCATDLYAGKGTAYFVLGPFAAAPDDDYVVANNQRNWSLYPRYDSDQVALAYYNPTALRKEDNAILREMRSQFTKYLITDGGEPEGYITDVRFNTWMYDFADTMLAVDLAEWIVDHIDTDRGTWDGVYFDECLTAELFAGTIYLDSVAKYTVADSAQVVADYGVYRDTLLGRLRANVHDRFIVVANCGYPPLEDYNNLSGISIEAGHITTQAKEDSANAVYRNYLFPGSGFHNIAWDWNSFYAHDGITY